MAELNVVTKEVPRIGRNLRWIRNTDKLNQEAFAEKIGVKRNDLANWETGRNKPEVEKLEKVREIYSLTLDDLFMADLASGEGKDWKKGVHFEPTEGAIPVYDNEFSLGFITTIQEARDQAKILAWLSIPEVKGCDAVVPVKGQSMADFINEKDWVGLKRVVDMDTIFWGQAYGIVTDELETIKYIRKNQDDKDIRRLCSHNHDYDEVEMHKNKIKELWIVRTVLPFSKIKTLI